MSAFVQGMDWHWTGKEMLKITIINTLRLQQNGRNFSDEIFKCIFLNEDV